MVHSSAASGTHMGFCSSQHTHLQSFPSSQPDALPRPCPPPWSPHLLPVCDSDDPGASCRWSHAGSVLRGQMSLGIWSSGLTRVMAPARPSFSSLVWTDRASVHSSVEQFRPLIMSAGWEGVAPAARGLDHPEPGWTRVGSGPTPGSPGSTPGMGFHPLAVPAAQPCARQH